MSSLHLKDYINPRDKFIHYKPEQTIIIKKQFLPHVSSLNYVEELPEPLPCDEWYPLVNSYYPFTEDVDAFARVHHLLAEIKSQENLDQKLSEEDLSTSAYSDRDARNQYLKTPPLSFLILGKPGLGEDDLARRLAEYWKCVYIDPQSLLEEEIKSDSRAGQCIEFNLRCGRAIGVDVIMKLLARKVVQPHVLHRGFVLCGFPLVPNDLYEEDPISSESAVFTVKDIFEEIMENVIEEIDDSVSKVQVSLFDSKEESLADRSELNVEITSEFEVRMSLPAYVNEVCGTRDLSRDIDKQINTLFGLFSEPFLIIYMFCRNSEVVSKRENYGFDIYSRKNVDMQKVDLFYEIGATHENLIRDLFDGGNNPFAENPTLKHLVKVPEHFPANVTSQLDHYHHIVAKLIDARVLLHDHDFYVKVDGRAFVSQMFDAVKERLLLLPVHKVLLPQKFGFTSFQEQPGEGLEPDVPEIDLLTVEEAFDKFSKQHTIAPQFKWGWSDWGAMCPVQMHRGVYVEGSPKHCVHFLNKIFFLADDESVERFIENPRRFLQPPYPRPGTRIFIFGPPSSGKSSVAKCLTYYLNSKYVNPQQLHEEYLAHIYAELKEKIRQRAITEAMEILQREKEAQLIERQANQEEELRVWMEQAKQVLSEIEQVFVSQEGTLAEGISSLSLTVRQEMDESQLFGAKDVTSIDHTLRALNMPVITDKEFCKHLLREEEILKSHAPEHLRVPLEVEPVSVLDPFVLDYVNDKVKRLKRGELEQTSDYNFYEMYINGLKSIEQNEYSGWIMDGMTTDVNLLKQVYDAFPVDEVVILIDSSEEHRHLLERFQTDPFDTHCKDLREFFISIGETEASYLCPSAPSTESYKKAMAQEILDDIIFKDSSRTEFTQNNLDEYKESLNHYDSSIENVFQFFEELGRKPFVFELEGKPVEEVMREVITQLKQKYREQATEMTELDRAEEVQMFLSDMAPLEGEGGGEDIGGGATENPFMPKRQYGDTYHYCPVTYAEKWVLWQGKEDFAVKYRGKVYLFCSEEAMQNFIEKPYKYLNEDSPPKKYPPPRLCVIGAQGSGKTTVAKWVSKNMNIVYVKYPGNLEEQQFDAFLNQNWFEEPLMLTGVVLDGFPENVEQLQLMIDRKCIPDAILYIAVGKDELATRIVSEHLAKWKEEMDQQRAEQSRIQDEVLREWEDKREARYAEIMEEKRQSRYTRKVSQDKEESPTEMAPNPLISETQVSFESVVDEKDRDDTMNQLNEEMPEPVFEEEIYETEEQATTRFVAEMEEGFFDILGVVEEMKVKCEQENIVWKDINGNLNLEKAITHALICTDDIKFRLCIFEQCFEIPLEYAEKLIEQGYYFLSPFGRTCPVRYQQRENLLHMFLATRDHSEVYPVIHRQYIYFTHGKANRDRFLRNPLKYARQKNVRFLLIPYRVAVIGPPKCGKSTAVSRFAKSLGFRTMSRGQAARYTLENLPFSQLAKSMEALLRPGKELTDQIVMDCVLAATGCGEATTRGLIFDGFPNTTSEMRQLAYLGLTPHLIFDIQATEEDIHTLASYPIEGIFPIFSAKFIKHRYALWQKDAAMFRKWCDREYQNVYRLKLDRCIWGMYDKMTEVALAVGFERKHYHVHAQDDWPLRLANMLVTPLEFLERQSNYQTKCPVCLAKNDCLEDGGEPPDRTGLVHYRMFFYWICGEHIEQFLKTPESYIPPYNRTLPQNIPQALHLNTYPENPVEKGFCLGCYADNLPEKVLVQGVTEFASCYRDRIYLFDAQECLAKFMRKPQLYCCVTIAVKELQEYPSVEYKDLPILGMLEQYLARIVVKAVTYVANLRPVVPGLSIPTSAAICLGLYLKVNNPKTSKQYRPYFERGLDQFHQRRQDLLTNLERMKNMLNPFVHYEDSESLSSDTIDADEAPPLNTVASMLAMEPVDFGSFISNTSEAILPVVDAILDAIDY